MPDVSEFWAAAENPTGYAWDFKKRTGRRIVGYLCSYFPEEIIFAAGALPFRIFGTGCAITAADSHLQSYCCSLVRGALEAGLKGECNFLDGTVFPHTCDSIQRLSDIWRLNIHQVFHSDIALPAKLNTGSARLYMENVIGGFRREMETKLGTEITPERLGRAISVYNRIRRGLGKLYLLRSREPSLICGSNVRAVIKASMIMDREEYLEKLESLNRELEIGQGVPFRGKRIVLAGGMCDSPEIFDCIEESGGAVVWDDLCTGTRAFAKMTDEEGDPLAAISARLLSRAVCPAKHQGLNSRRAGLLGICREHRADGVVFVTLKFCDPHSFDYPGLKEILDREGIPSILVDIGGQPGTPAGERIRMRLETFIQIL